MLPRITPRPNTQADMNRGKRGGRGVSMMCRRRGPLKTESLFFAPFRSAHGLIQHQMSAKASLVMTIKWFKAKCWCMRFRMPAFTPSRATACRKSNTKRDLQHHFHATVGNIGAACFEWPVLRRGHNCCWHNGFSTVTIAAAVQIWHCALIQTAEYANGARPDAPWRRCDHLWSTNGSRGRS